MSVLACLTVPCAWAAVIDDFQGTDLSDYTYTVLLDVGGGLHNGANWQIVNGQLQINTAVYRDIEQSAFVKTGYTLRAGEELRADCACIGGNRAIGLYAGVIPADGVRQNYVTVYAESSTSVLSRGFNGTSEMNIKSGSGSYTKLFIARDGENDYEAGYYNGDIRTVVADRNSLVFGAGDVIAVGFYADVRSSGALGNVDNLEIVSIPRPPIIVNNPVSVTTTQLQNAALETVFESRTPPSARWYKATSGTDLPMDPAEPGIDIQLTYDAQNELYKSTLTKANLSVEDSGQYYCRVTNDCDIPAVSAMADLIVQGLAAHWTLDQEGTILAESGHVYLEEIAAQDALANGVPVFVAGVDGIAGHAVEVVNGRGSAICPVLDPVKQSGRMTISFWAKWNAAAGEKEDVLAESTFCGTLRDSDGLKGGGTWQHICMVYDGAAGRLYVDGVLKDQGPWLLPISTEAAMCIGTAGDGQMPFNGALDDIKFFNYALSDTEVADLRYALSGERSCILEFDARYDLVPDCTINLDDLVMFVLDWIEGKDLAEFADFASSWQSGGLYPPEL